jgi:hypothetical protein
LHALIQAQAAELELCPAEPAWNAAEADADRRVRRPRRAMCSNWNTP